VLPLLLYIFSLPLLVTTTINALNPYALNDEFQHLILKFNKNFLTLLIPLKERIAPLFGGQIPHPSNHLQWHSIGGQNTICNPQAFR
jgi:hypothetical protein